MYRSLWVDDEVAALKDMARKFFDTEGAPNRERWEQQQHIDREFWLKAGKLGLLCAAIPVEYGGGGGSIAHDLAIFEAASASGETGFGNHAHSGVVAHYLATYGTEEQKRRWLPRMATGELLGAVAMTEPGAGSDLKALRTTAIRDGDHYRLNGAKTFITNGATADIVVLVVKTNPAAASVHGISLLVLETADAAGFKVGRKLKKVGMKAADTAELFFDDVRVPVANLLGKEGKGFSYSMAKLPWERLIIAIMGIAALERAVEETVAYTKQRKAFGQTLFDMQNTRFELAECATVAHIARVFVDSCIDRHLRGELDPAAASMAKYWVTDIQCQVVDRCVQLFGGYGYMLEYPIAQMFIDGRAQRIYGGANEVMKELIARSL
ncbi:MAG: acrC 7 [Amycolatopsis sp.]|uniref:acyl-CoA dehydrogenase family protein n=1 Tax=Amycolatopsis sp. TaxID=37632 RepID=UPI00262E239E|nr:acyl-CoA dehydrogenase family protein [Amycolatopsis sp.]MCU1683918.1 acrC 7 [Amycolatopsis sp.]